ncbi:hypothetical protein DB30_05293 [Enhygromyxa salina]|uniref:Uncharacterized protein n=1 Tax=Enhygromyxa salina TaxID=215803 RepID=A0A0C1ZXC9_9BACT|nr:hypothetical protein DB30_05293 [Enhygromyxa salina]
MAGCALLLPLASVGCGDAHWDAVRWPTQEPGAPAQPHSESAASGVSLRALAIEWEPDAVVVELEISNQAEAPLTLEPGAILLAWAELEYAPEPPGPDEPARPQSIEIPAARAAVTKLRYQLSRPLNGPGARLVVRASSRGGVAIVDLPQLELPPFSDHDT